MTDPTLQRIWAAREAISKECGYDSRRLVEFYKQIERSAESQKKSGHAVVDRTRPRPLVAEPRPEYKTRKE